MDNDNDPNESNKHHERPEHSDPNDPNEHLPTDQELEEATGLANDPEALTTKMFQDGLIAAAQTITHIAAYSESEKLRFEAAKYVIERILGKPDTKKGIDEEWQVLFEKLQQK